MIDDEHGDDDGDDQADAQGDDDGDDQADEQANDDGENEGDGAGDDDGDYSRMMIEHQGERLILPGGGPGNHGRPRRFSYKCMCSFIFPQLQVLSCHK